MSHAHDEMRAGSSHEVSTVGVRVKTHDGQDAVLATDLAHARKRHVACAAVDLLQRRLRDRPVHVRLAPPVDIGRLTFIGQLTFRHSIHIS